MIAYWDDESCIDLPLCQVRWILSLSPYARHKLKIYDNNILS